MTDNDKEVRQILCNLVRAVNHRITLERSTMRAKARAVRVKARAEEQDMIIHEVFYDLHKLLRLADPEDDALGEPPQPAP